MFKNWIIDKYNKNTFWVPLCLGVFIIINNLIWIIMNGGRWFEPIPDNGIKPEFYNGLNRVFGSFYMLFYFTIQTNLFLAISFILFAFFNRNIKYQSLFTSSCVLITITFIIYWAAIAPFSKEYIWKSVYYQFYNIFVHVINPLIGFIYLIIIRDKIEIKKSIIGKSSLYIPAFVIGNAVLYGTSAIVIDNKLDAVSVYSFLDLQNVLFINLENMHALAWFINVMVIIISPFIGILLSIIWIWSLKIKTIKYDDYYKLFTWIKNKCKKNKTIDVLSY